MIEIKDQDGIRLAMLMRPPVNALNLRLMQELGQTVQAVRDGPASFAFFQHCMSPERHTLAVLAASLKAYLEGAVTYGAAAGLLLQAARKRAP